MMTFFITAAFAILFSLFIPNAEASKGEFWGRALNKPVMCLRRVEYAVPGLSQVVTKDSIGSMRQSGLVNATSLWHHLVPAVMLDRAETVGFIRLRGDILSPSHLNLLRALSNKQKAEVSDSYAIDHIEMYKKMLSARKNIRAISWAGWDLHEHSMQILFSEAKRKTLTLTTQYLGLQNYLKTADEYQNLCKNVIVILMSLPETKKYFYLRDQLQDVVMSMKLPYNMVFMGLGEQASGVLGMEKKDSPSQLVIYKKRARVFNESFASSTKTVPGNDVFIPGILEKAFKNSVSFPKKFPTVEHILSRPGELDLNTEPLKVGTYQYSLFRGPFMNGVIVEETIQGRKQWSIKTRNTSHFTVESYPKT